MSRLVWLAINGFVLGSLFTQGLICYTQGRTDGVVSYSIVMVFIGLSIRSDWKAIRLAPVEPAAVTPEPEPEAPKKKCPPHKWEYKNKDGGMTCSYCGTPPKV